MNRNELTASSLWERVAACEEEVRAARGREDLTTESKALLDRIGAVVAHVKSTLESAQVDLLSAAMVNATDQHLVNLQNYVANYTSSGQTTYLVSADQHCDEALRSISAWPEPISRSARLAAAQSKVNSLVESFNGESDAAFARAAQLREEVERLAVQRGQIEQELSTLGTQIAAQAAMDQDAAASRSKQFESSQALRSTEFEKLVADKAKEHNAALDKNQAELAKQLTVAHSLLEAMQERKAEVEKVAGATASGVLAGEFGRYARNTFALAMVAYALGVLLIVGAGIAIFAALEAMAPATAASWQWVAMKFGVTAAAAAAGSILISLGSRLLRDATANKRLELEIRAIGPFLADVDDLDSVRKTKLDFLSRSFGRESESDHHGPGNDQVSVAAFGSIIGDVLKLVNRGQ